MTSTSWSRVKSFLLLTALIALPGCAASTQSASKATATTTGAADTVAAEEAQVEKLTQEAFSSGGKEGARTLIDAYLKDLEYPSAYVAVQVLREIGGDSSEELRRLGDACWGLGVYQEAASAYYAALQGEGECEHCYWDVAQILVASGQWEQAQSFLAGPINNGDGMSWVYLFEETLETQSQRLDFLQAYAKAHPEDEEAQVYLAQVQNYGAHGGPGKIVSGMGETIHTRLTDTFDVFVEVNGYRTRLTFDTGASGIILSGNAAKMAGIDKGEEILIYGLGTRGGSGATKSYVGFAEEVKMGNLTFEDYPIRISRNSGGFNQGWDGLIGPDVLPGWAYMMDRKKEVLEFYPPGAPLPDLGPAALSQPFHMFHHHIMADVGVANRVSGSKWEVKMVLDTGAQLTLYNLDYAERLDFGDLQTTATLPFSGLAGTTKAVKVNNSEVHVGGANFMFKTFWAINGMDTWRPMPYGLIGRDVLSRFKILVVPRERRLVLDVYPL